MEWSQPDERGVEQIIDTSMVVTSRTFLTLYASFMSSLTHSFLSAGTPLQCVQGFVFTISSRSAHVSSVCKDSFIHAFGLACTLTHLVWAMGLSGLEPDAPLSLSLVVSGTGPDTP